MFAADVYAHKNCMKKFFKKNFDNIEELLQTFNDVEWQETKAFEVQIAIGEFCWSLELDGKGYEISTWNQVNQK